jgi:hypothetical protein
LLHRQCMFLKLKLERQMKNLENMNRKLVISYNKLAGLVRNLELELANKVDKIF